MKRYKVLLREIAVYEVEIEADDEKDIPEIAEEAYVQGTAVFHAVEERDVSSYQEING
jgi:hypothetical protein